MVATGLGSATIALIGSPNTGKSTLFGALSGMRQRVGNYPGVTVEKAVGQFMHDGRRWTIVDLPGTYSLAPRSLDEIVAVDVLLGRRPDVPPPDVVLCVIAADNLAQNLYLLSQVLELGRPTVVALTMLDVARSNGLRIDVGRLQQRLGVPVIPVEAHRGRGLAAVKEALAAAVGHPAPVPESPFPEPFRSEVARLESNLATARGQDRLAPPKLPRYLVERLLLDTGGYIENQLSLNGHCQWLRDQLQAGRERLACADCPVPAIEVSARYGWIDRTLEGIVERSKKPVVTPSDRADALLTHKLWGTVFLVLVMLLVFTAVFNWAQIPMDLIESGVSAVGSKVESLMPPGALRSLIVEGAIGGIGAVVVFLPQIFILFFFLATLEDCGYLARAAYLMDKIMVRVGLSGKSFIPLLSSFACAIPGIMATRVIENRRDRLATMLIAPLMGCSARLPIYTLMIAAFIPNRAYLGGILGLQALTLFSMYLLGIIVAAGVALLLRCTLLRGITPPFFMELPAYKWPTPGVVLHRAVDRGMDFVRNAGTLIFAVSIIMWAVLYYPRVAPHVIAPLVAQQTELETALDQARTTGDLDQAAIIEGDLGAVRDHIDGIQKRQSFLGRAGHLIEPAVRPLGWDWRIGSAVVASFPAREVVVASLAVIFDAGAGVDTEEKEGSQQMRQALQSATWAGTDRPLFNVPVALSVMVFFALCAQCVSTLVVIGRESHSFVWPIFTFTYLTTIAYIFALLTYQIGMWLAA